MLRRSLIAVTACATLLCANSAGAQERQIGVTVGASLASVTRESGPAGEDPYDGRTGFAAGAFFHLPVRDRLQLQIESLFTEKGGSVPLRDPGIVQGSLRIRYKFHYLDVPVLARVRGPRIGSALLHVFGGPTFSLRLEGQRQTVFSGETAFGYQLDLGDEMERFDVGLTVGAGIQIARALFDARYTQGSRDVVSDLNGARLKNRAVLITAGVQIF
jgi:hypothetical protein